MDRNQADLTFLEIVDGWLRERLSGGQGGILAEKWCCTAPARPWR
jgi:exodeoxyribonuclease-5